MCVVEGAILGGIIPGLDPLDRKGKAQRQQDKEMQAAQWAREDAHRAEDREHELGMAEQGFGKGGSWKQGNVNQPKDLSSRTTDKAY